MTIFPWLVSACLFALCLYMVAEAERRDRELSK